jgi:biotin carboxylase
MILGAGVMQGPALRIAREMGLQTVAVDADPRAPSVPLADRFEQIDLKDKEGIAALARSLRGSGGLKGVMTAGTDFSAAVAWAAKKARLPGIPYETALDASDKERMRRRFKEAGVPSPEFTILRENPPEGFAPPFPFPVVVKPVDNMGSRGCRRADDPGELAAAVEEALQFSRSGRVIVEEYMEGPEFSVDAIVFKGKVTICGLADRHIFFPPYFIEMGHTIPSALDPGAMEKLLEVFKAGIRALGINLGAAKGDLKLTPRGPMIGEIAARLSGGYMSGWTYPYSSGVEPAAGAIMVCMGKKPEDLSPRKFWTSAERAFISIPGRINSIYGIKKARDIPRIKDIFFQAEPGSRVRFPENNVSKCGNVISAAPNREEAVQAAENAARSILIRLEAPDEETERFLAVPPSPENAFPPDAFSLPPVLYARLRDLPDPEPGKGPSGAEPALLVFPEFLGREIRDYTGRTLTESLEAVRLLTGCTLPLVSALSGPGRKAGAILGRRFWAALIRGGYQGGAYVVDSARKASREEGER